VSFTLSQLGMVRHWQRAEVGASGVRRKQAINAVGAAFTGLVLVVVLITKFTHGAWIVTIAMPVLFLLMKSISRHYGRVSLELLPSAAGVALPSRIHGVVPVSKLHEPTLRALAFARATRPHDLTAVTVQIDPEETRALVDGWDARSIIVPLTIIDSPYREITR